ncbi:MAG: hypothetical protein ABL967_13965 [Bryobacteraceae bacterium]
MKLKSYFSGTVEAAMELARKELGEDALLVNARPSTPETRSLGAFEVVFGVVEQSPPPEAPASKPPQASLAADVAELRREMERMARFLHDSRRLPATAGPAVEQHAQLARTELDQELVTRYGTGTPLEELFSTDSTLGQPGSNRAVVAFVGPPGAGKTSALVKLAANYGLAGQRPAQIITADVFRIAAADQLRHLAAILGIGCDVVETPLALAQALEEHHGKQYVFIDTPGLAAAEMEEGAELAQFLAGHPEIDIHLVLPASMRAADLAAVIDRYQVFQPHKLLFTRMDEASQFGPLINESARVNLPISFLTSGQQIPDDIEAATNARIRDLVLSGTSGLLRKGAAA